MEGKNTPYPGPSYKTDWGRQLAESHDLYHPILTVISKSPADRGSLPENVGNYLSKTLFHGEVTEGFDINKNESGILTIQINDRTVTTQDGNDRILLKNVRLNVHDGELVLILGGSGVGKTTFLDAVMGNERANAVIEYRGYNIYEDFERVKHFIGHVPQSDPLRNEDTVYMTLHNAAELKLPTAFVRNQKALEERVEKVLKIVNLSNEKDNLVSKLSGGQRKRLSIASEYISDPYLFFLDEPDSGLDGNQARILMKNLRAIADEDKIVLVISHVPDRMRELFDKVIVLGKDETTNAGTLAFFGKVDEALDFFSVKTLEEIVEKLENSDGEESAGYYIRKFEEERDAGSAAVPETQENVTPVAEESVTTAAEENTTPAATESTAPTDAAESAAPAAQESTAPTDAAESTITEKTP